MTTVSSNAIRFTISAPPAGGSPPSSSGQGQARKLFAGTHYYYGGRSDEPPFAILAYSGCAYDPSSGRMFLFGGGHHDYSGNEVWELSVDRPQDRWTRHYLPSSYATRSAVATDIDNARRPGMYVSTGRPISRHTHHAMVWAPNVRRMFVGGGSTWDGPDGSYWSVYPNSPHDLWAYDPTARNWDYRGSGLVDRSRPVSFALVHDAKRGTVLTLTGRRTTSYDPAKVAYSYADGPPTVWEYEPATDRWTDHGVGLAGQWNYMLMTADPVRDRLVVLAWDTARQLRVFDYDLARRAWVPQQTQGNVPPPPFFPSGSIREGDAVRYSTFSNKLLYVSAINDGALYGLDTTTWQWAQLLQSGAFPQIEQAFAACWCPVRNEMYLAYKLTKAQTIDVIAVKA